jgi:hypothetical protein
MTTTTATDYAIRYLEVCDYVKIVCNSYMFPLYEFIHDTHIKEVRAKLLEGINKKLMEEFRNVLRNKDYEFGMQRLDALRNELDAISSAKAHV